MHIINPTRMVVQKGAMKSEKIEEKKVKKNY
jgi:hypothetical protein